MGCKMNLKIEELGKNYMLNIGGVAVEIDLADIENLITHLEYFKNNDSIEEMEIKIGGIE
jgi:hypothetical protein